MKTDAKPIFVRFLPEEIVAIDNLRKKSANGFGIARSLLIRDAVLAYLQKHKEPVLREGDELQ